MTREEILAMEPGMDLDALVAEEVMGLEGVQVLVPREYSASISAAWEVVEKIESLESAKVLTALRLRLTHLSAREWKAEFLEKISGKTFEARAFEASEAICKAALLAALHIK